MSEGITADRMDVTADSTTWTADGADLAEQVRAAPTPTPTPRRINIGKKPNDGTGDPARLAFKKCNDNFLDLYELFSLAGGGGGGGGSSNGDGEQGPPGPPGPEGPMGPAGPPGPQGDPGPAGADGATGPQGPQGDPGAAGATGAQGPQGDVGPQGPAGATGAQGPAGATGAQGPPGTPGAQGPQGPPGVVSASPPLTFNSGTGALTIDLSAYAPLASPTFTGDPKAPTPPFADNDTSIATTAWVTTALGGFQPLDADLTSIAGYGGTGTWLYRSTANTWSAVSLGSGLTFTGGTLDAPLFTSSAKGEVPASGGGTANFLRADGTWSTPAGGGNVSNSGTPTSGQYAKWVTATTIQGVAPATVLSDIGAQPAGSYQPLDATLSALAAYNTNGLLTQTAADTFTGRTLTGPAAGITVSNGNGVAGNPTLALANDLAALEALGGTNTIYYRNGSDSWAAVTIGSGLSFSGGTLAASGGGGDVFLAGNNTFTGQNYFTNITNLPLVVGHTARITTSLALEVNGISGKDGVADTRWGNDAVGAALLLRKSRGAAVGTNTVVNSGDVLGFVSFAGNHGTGFQAGGPTVQGVCNSSPFGTNTPGFIQIDAVTIGGAKVTAATFKDTGSAILGTNTNDSAAAGIVGECIEAQLAPWGLGLTSTVAVAVTSIALTAGDWDVSGAMHFNANAATGAPYGVAKISATSADIAAAGLGFAAVSVQPLGVGSATIPPFRVSLTSSQTYYLNAYSVFGGSMTCGGGIHARRVR